MLALLLLGDASGVLDKANWQTASGRWQHVDSRLQHVITIQSAAYGCRAAAVRGAGCGGGCVVVSEGGGEFASSVVRSVELRAQTTTQALVFGRSFTVAHDKHFSAPDIALPAWPRDSPNQLP